MNTKLNSLTGIIFFFFLSLQGKSDKSKNNFLTAQMRKEKGNLQVIVAQAEELKEAQKEACCNLFHRNTHKDGRKATLCSQQYWQGNCSGYLSLVHQCLRKLYIPDLCLCAKARPSLCLSLPSSNQAKKFHQIVIISGSILLTCR